MSEVYKNDWIKSITVFSSSKWNIAEHWQRIKNIQVAEVSGLDEFRLIRVDDFKTWKQSMVLDYELKVKKANRD